MPFGDCQRANTTLCLSCAALAISLIVIAVLVYVIKKNKCNCCDGNTTNLTMPCVDFVHFT